MAQSIPASELVDVIPSVLSAGGSNLQLSGLVLSYNKRVPIGTVARFPNPAAVTAFFGGGSVEAQAAAIYFAGYDTSTAKPAAMLFAQYVWQTPVGAYLRSGNIAAMTLAQLQALAPGVITLTIDGQAHTSSTINLSSASSFSAAAGLIQTALGANDASVTGSIGPATSAFTGVIAATTLTTSAVTGPIVPGATVSGSGVTANTTIVSQLTGTAGGAGTYQVSISQTVGSEAMTSANTAAGVLTVSAVGSGTLQVGDGLAGSGVTTGTAITGLLTGTGGTGTYIVSPSQTASSTTITVGGVTVTFDSTSGAFVIAAGSTGAASTITFASGSMAALLLMTAATGATLSQGSDLSTPVAFMSALRQVAANWATFSTLFYPSIADQVAFAQWTNTTNSAVAYSRWSTDASEAQTPLGTSSALYLIKQAGYSGTNTSYDPLDLGLAVMWQGFAASINFNTPNGSTTFAYLTQAGIDASVTSDPPASILLENGANFYGTYSTSSASFNSYQNGQISGPFLWADDYVEQIWFSAQLQAAGLALMQSVGQIPYNPPGRTMIAEALSGPIQQAVTFGMINGGVTLSSTQVVAVNNAAGPGSATILSNRGWYLFIGDPGATVRQARGSPVVKLFYVNGGSVQIIDIASILVQ